MVIKQIKFGDKLVHAWRKELEDHLDMDLFFKTRNEVHNDLYTQVYSQLDDALHKFLLLRTRNTL